MRRERTQSQVKVFLRVFKSVILHRIIMPTLRITLLSTLIGTISCTSLEQHKPHWLWHSVGYTALWHNLPRKTLLKQCGTKTDYPRKGFCGETFHRPAMELFTYAAQIHLIRKDVFNLSKFLTKGGCSVKKGRWESALFVTAEKQADVTYYTNGIPN